MPSPSPSPINGTGALEINSPELPNSARLSGGKPPVRAITTELQAANIVRRVENDNAERNTKNARIQAKANAERPFDNNEMTRDGLGWKSNFSTQPLPSLIGRVSPRLVQLVNEAKYLTNSKLPDTTPGSARKTEAFRREITTTIRARPAWQDLLQEVAQETSLFGYTGIGWLDEDTYFPKHFRGDRFMVPQGTKQKANLSQVIVFVEHYQPHELFELIRDTEAAREAGWDIANTVEAINTAQPDSLRRQNSQDYSRVYEDLAREANLGNSLQSGAKQVVIYNVLVYEITGKVSHWRIRYPDYRKVFVREDRFKSMDEAAHFFSFEQGNGTLHGSKGVGRIVYAMAGILDRSRNEVVDRLQLAGKVIVQGTDTDIRKFKMSVFGNAILIGQAFQISQFRIEPHTEEFFQLDSYLRSLLDELAGNVSPKHLQGERVTAKQVELYAQREEEGKDNVLSRWALQVAEMITIMQRKMCSSDVQDEDAKAMRERLLKIMSPEELKTISMQPAAGVVKDLTDIDRQKIVLVASEAQGNPLYDQRELQKRKVSALIDDEFAEAVLLDVNDPTQTAEQSRLQNMENLLLAMGQKVPVSPRDSHLVHLQLLVPSIQALVDGMQSDSSAVEQLVVLLDHAKGHTFLGLQTGEDQDFYKQIEAKIAETEKRVKQIMAFEQNVKDLVAGGMPPEEAIRSAGGAVPPGAGQGMAAGGPPPTPQPTPPAPPVA